MLLRNESCFSLPYSGATFQQESLDKKFSVLTLKSTPKYAKRQEIIYETWLKNFSTSLGDVKFIKANPLNESNILSLSGVNDNVYPPQRKSFQLLFYMYKNLISEYDFFLRIGKVAV